MRRRRGITLIEVLVAIFIMAIGLLAILTLFPLGAMRMGQALQDDRAASSASAGANLADAWNIRNDPSFYSAATGVNLYVNPNVGGLPALPPNGTGYPLYVDPYGVASGSAALVGGAIPRVLPSVFPAPYNNSTNMAFRYFTLLDDMTFLDNGAPDTGTTGNVQRGGQYTWAYLLRRSEPATPTSPVDMTVVVYAHRATSVAGGEATFTAAGNAGDTAVSLTWAAGAQLPGIKRGSWILDTSFDTQNNTVMGVHGLFYRVVSVSQPSNTVMNLELQAPLGKSVTSVTVLDNVVEVFARGTYSNHWEFRNEQ
jgi:prepilin-type N-terminal cleavage/methylation domain-containing protein